MPFPPIPPFRGPFKGFSAAEALKQFTQLVNQPTLTNAIKEAAQKLGLNELNPMANVQEILRQAGRWVETSVEPWSQLDRSSLVPGINATGEWFNARWTAPQLLKDVSSLPSLVYGSFTQDSAVEPQLKKLLLATTGAADALITPNLSSAIFLATKAYQQSGAIDEIVLPRIHCIRIPSSVSHGGVHVRSIIDAAGTRVTEIGSSTDCQIDDYRRAIGTNRTLLVLSSPTAHDDCKEQGIHIAREKQAAVIEIALDASIHDLEPYGIPAHAMTRRWQDGPDLMIIPGQSLLAGPECGIVLGTADAVAKVRVLSEQIGMQADRVTIAVLCETLRRIESLDGWKQSPIGSTICTSIENLENRARRMAIQLEVAPSIETIDVAKTPCRLGSGNWQSVKLDSATLKLKPKNRTASQFADLLAALPAPIWCNVLSDHVEFVVRSIDPSDDHVMIDALLAIDAEDPLVPDVPPTDSKTL
ncbi:MAG: hypothetical protein ACK5O8_12005 [Pirellula sp.]